MQNQRNNQVRALNDLYNNPESTVNKLITTEFDQQMMRTALKLAHEAAAMDEVPVGALVVIGNQIVGEGFNRSRIDCDPSAHAEVIALRSAAVRIKNYRLTAATLYTTLEPCVMCVGVLLHARIERLVYGARDPKFGAAGSLLNLPESPFMNHQCLVSAGVLQDECSALVSNFFLKKRNTSQ